MNLSPLDKPTQQHLNRWAQQSVRPTQNNSIQTALAEARLEAYLTQVTPNPHTAVRIQQPKNIF
jgi:hypothetical protein